MALKTYQIQEEQNGAFARIQARTPEAALRKAAREFPRRADDYNLEPGQEPYRVEWRAIELTPDGTDFGTGRAVCTVVVPSRGDGSVRF